MGTRGGKRIPKPWPADKPVKTEADLKKALPSRWWRLNNLYKVINEQGQEVTFKYRPVQQALYSSNHPFKIILKSRQHGITTQRCIESLDDCLFSKNLRAGIIAHNREDAEFFFRDKIKFAYDRLPAVLRQIISSRQDSARELSFNNNSAIRVGVSMRSATLQRLHISELGKISARYPEKAKEIKTGALNTVHVGQQITIESTAEGNSGLFYDLCQDAITKAKMGVKLSPLDFEFHFYAWWQDPKNSLPPDQLGIETPGAMKTYFQQLHDEHGITLTDAQRAWYVAKWVVQGDDMLQEHPSTPEEAFRGSVEGAYFRRQFNDIYREHRITTVPYEPGYLVDTFWDLGMDDSMVIWFVQTIGKEVRVIDCYANSGEGLAHYAEVLNRRPYHYGKYVAPHDIKVRELGTGVSRLERAVKYGLRFEVAPRLDKPDQIEAARALLPYCWFDEQKCKDASDGKSRRQEYDGISALENYRKEWDERNAVFKDRPLHDWCSNYADAFMVLAVTHEITQRYRQGGGDDARLMSYRHRVA